MHPPDHRSTVASDVTAALDLFDREEGGTPEQNGAQQTGGVFVFDCEAQPPVETAMTGKLLEAAPAVPTRLVEHPAPLSRVEARATHRRHRRRSYVRWLAARAAALRGWLGRAGDTVTNGVHRGSSAATYTATHLGRRLRRSGVTLYRRAAPGAWGAARAGGRPATSGPVVMPGLQPDGVVVAVLLGLTVVSYGSFVAGSWQTGRNAGPSTRSRDMRPAAATLSARPLPAADVVSAPAEAPLRVTVVRTMPAVSVKRAVAVIPRGDAFTPSSRTLTAMWQRRDTRSLEQAFATLRQQTLAFHRCGLRMTAPERALARCEGVATAKTADGTLASRRATWTIEFRRAAGRWLIDRVTRR